MIAGHASRNALPSGSFGNMPPTTLFVSIRFHMGTKHPPNASTPKKNIVVNLNGTGLAGSACRPKNHACHGTTVDRHGTPCVSHTVATGFVVSGVELVTIRSAWSCRISSRATSDARFGSDWVSFTTMSTLYVLLPTVKPFVYASVARIRSTTKLSPEANPAS